jgi:hypothetical protein
MHAVWMLNIQLLGRGHQRRNKRRGKQLREEKQGNCEKEDKFFVYFWFIGFVVFTEMMMRSLIFWDVPLCSVLKANRRRNVS